MQHNDQTRISRAFFSEHMRTSILYIKSIIATQEPGKSGFQLPDESSSSKALDLLNL